MTQPQASSAPPPLHQLYNICRSGPMCRSSDSIVGTSKRGSPTFRGFAVSPLRQQENNSLGWKQQQASHKSECGSARARALEVSEAQPECQGRFMFQTCKAQLRFHPSVHTQRIPPGSRVHVPSGSALSEPPPHTATGCCCCVQCTAINSKQREQGTWKSKS